MNEKSKNQKIEKLDDSARRRRLPRARVERQDWGEGCRVGLEARGYPLQRQVGAGDDAGGERLHRGWVRAVDPPGAHHRIGGESWRERGGRKENRCSSRVADLFLRGFD